MKNATNGFDHTEKKYISLPTEDNEVIRLKYDPPKKLKKKETFVFEQQNGIF